MYLYKVHLCQASVLSSKSEQHFTENTYLRFPGYFSRYYMIYWFAFTQDILMDRSLFFTMYPYGEIWFSVIPLRISKDPRKLRPKTRKLRPPCFLYFWQVVAKTKTPYFLYFWPFVHLCDQRPFIFPNLVPISTVFTFVWFSFPTNS